MCLYNFIILFIFVDVYLYLFIFIHIYLYLFTFTYTYLYNFLILSIFVDSQEFIHRSNESAHKSCTQIITNERRKKRKLLKI